MAGVAFVGTPTEPFETKATCSAWRELTVMGSRGFVAADIREVIDLYIAAVITVDHLVEVLSPLRQANDALEGLPGQGEVCAYLEACRKGEDAKRS